MQPDYFKDSAGEYAVFAQCTTYPILLINTFTLNLKK